MRANLPCSMTERKIVQNLTQKALNTAHICAQELENRAQEEFAVSLRAQDGGFNDIDVSASKSEQRFLHLFDGCQLSSFVAHDASLANEFPSGFELRFDQDDNVPPTAF